MGERTPSRACDVLHAAALLTSFNTQPFHSRCPLFFKNRATTNRTHTVEHSSHLSEPTRGPEPKIKIKNFFIRLSSRKPGKGKQPIKKNPITTKTTKQNRKNNQQQTNKQKNKTKQKPNKINKKKKKPTTTTTKQTQKTR